MMVSPNLFMPMQERNTATYVRTYAETHRWTDGPGPEEAIKGGQAKAKQLQLLAAIKYVVL